MHPALHPGKSAHILCGTRRIGWIGALHPRIQDALGLSEEVLLFEVRCEDLFACKPAGYQSISKYPHMRRDLSLLVPKEVCAAQLKQAITSIEGMDCLQSIDFFDVYTGPSIPFHQKSMGIALIFQRAQRTLVDQEINEFIDAILKKLQQEFSITLRFDRIE